MASKLFHIFKYVLAFGLLSWVVVSHWDPATGVGLKGIWQRHWVEGEAFGWSWFAGAVVCQVVALFLTLVRWHGLVIALNLVCPFRDAIRLGLAGFYASVVLPGAVGGDLVKATVLARRSPLGKTRAVASVIMDRLIALTNLFLIVGLLGLIYWLNDGLAGGLDGKPGLVVKAAWILGGATFFGWWLLGWLPDVRVEKFASRLRRWFPRGVGEAAAHFWLSVHAYRMQPWVVVRALSISWIGQTVMVLGFYCITMTVSDETTPAPALSQMFLILPVGLVIMAIPLFPGGAGIAELGFGLLFGWFGANESLGVTSTLLNRLVVWLVAGCCFGVYMTSKDMKEAAKHPDSRTAPKSNLESVEPASVNS